MQEQVDEQDALFDNLSKSSAIDSVQRTPGTERSGKWCIITTAEHRAQAEKDVDEAIELAMLHSKIENKYGFPPKRVSKSLVAIE